MNNRRRQMRKEAYARAWASVHFGLPEPAEVTVRCQQANHKIRYTPGGPLTFLGHPALRAEQLLADVGGHPCRCLEVLRGWQDYNKSRVPPGLKTHLDVSIELARRRRPYRPAAARKKEAATAAVRAEREFIRTQAVALYTFNQCQYRRSTTGHNERTVQVGARPRFACNVVGHTRAAHKAFRTQTNVSMIVTVGRAWLRRVYDRQMGATADGQFVAAVLEPRDVEHAGHLGGDALTALFRRGDGPWWWDARAALDFSAGPHALVGLQDARGLMIYETVCRLGPAELNLWRVTAVWRNMQWMPWIPSSRS
jgi:hypothetical protein